MAAPAIALRFRDTIPNVDTIRAHRSVLHDKGSVWWGWWKKDFEEAHLAFLADLQAIGSFVVSIVDRSTQRMFRANVSRLQIGRLEGAELDFVPDYYLDYEERVFAWFMLSSIEETSFDNEMAARFGDHTLISLATAEDNRAEKLAADTNVGSRSCILHLSDLHFGSDYAFATQREKLNIGDSRRTLTDCLSADLKRIGQLHNIAAVLVTGDFTTGGDWRDETRENVLQEFEALRDVLGLRPEQIIAVPGNHDIVRYPKGSSVDIAAIVLNNQTTYQHEREFRTFVDELIGRNWKESLNYVHRIRLKDADLLLCLLNSCTIAATEWTEYGFVGTSGIDAIGALRDEPINRPTFKFVALHHHLLPVAGVEAPNSKGVTLSLDASDLLDAAQNAGAHVALHGHEHMPRIARYQTVPLRAAPVTPPLHVISNGSAGGKRMPGNERNAYCLFELGAEKLHLWMRELRFDAKEGGGLFDGLLNTEPQMP
ncbi:MULTISPECIES: metallophosphoesterase family protein [Bradyrhizobium]|jgi:predicted phosphodiesterase|uniref:metallophosphoesterase family protein n=1 Tax=Bradyrhizobium TaxID=374 RepID=UPI000487C48C|nr:MULTISPECIES: metallophosphoesterase [Bradyrhizobium]MCS3444981.1 putative phosphodiesterase [Bradyrhizobium elkanii]MCS3563891.1 putative phosphodiesterase [Bradyrhizobium elkanii]MCW2146277.1 putative phosphodiesterase [Bradyrhizobium elkanii]MCW2379104.1 putative phosphodiesterase [Bradyrhizobium elkanii]MDI2104962.1 metallophosphoesterase [Bradyrhizobium sp. Mp64]